MTTAPILGVDETISNVNISTITEDSTAAAAAVAETPVESAAVAETPVESAAELLAASKVLLKKLALLTMGDSRQ